MGISDLYICDGKHVRANIRGKVLLCMLEHLWPVFLGLLTGSSALPGVLT